MSDTLLTAVIEQMQANPEAALVLRHDLLAMSRGEETLHPYSKREKWALGMVISKYTPEQLEAALNATGQPTDPS